MALATTLVGLGWMSPPVQAQTTPTTALAFQVTTTTVKATTTTVAPTTNTTKAPTTTKATTKTTPAIATTAVAATTSGLSTAAMIALANSVRRTPPSNDAALLAALRPLQKLGYTAQQAAIAGMGQFPVAGPAYYTDDWLEYRPGPPPENHHGIDIDAAMGTPLRSPVDGVLKYDTSDPSGYGLAADVTAPDGTIYVMAHMSATITGLATGSAVKVGQVIGLVGESGDATGPHCHFEIHPQGGAGIDAKPILDGWQAAAIRAIPALIDAIEGIPDTTAVPVAPLQVVLPVPQAAFSQPLPATVPISKTHSGPNGALVLIALVALLVAAALSVERFGPWPVFIPSEDLGEPPAGRPKRAR